MISLLAEKIAKYIKIHIPDHPASVNVLKHSISFILNVLFVVSLSLLASVFTQKTFEAGIILISFAMLRQVSGGIHLKSGVLCVILTTLGITIVSYTPDNEIFTNVANLVNIILVLLFAPSRIDKQTRISKKHYPLLKIISLFLVSTNFLIGSSVLAAAFLIQSLTLIKFEWKTKAGEEVEA